jgi:hypothetical protein
LEHALPNPFSARLSAGTALVTRVLVLAMLISTSVAAPAQDAAIPAAPYCAELKELNNYAMTRQRFAPIIGKPLAGNYSETRLPLSGWVNCAFYGTTTYTCDSIDLKSREDAKKSQERVAKEILACFGGTWNEAPEQMGPDFIVLHPKLGPASITLNLDETDTMSFIVRFILFLRR